MLAVRRRLNPREAHEKKDLFDAVEQRLEAAGRIFSRESTAATQIDSEHNLELRLDQSGGGITSIRLVATSRE